VVEAPESRVFKPGDKVLISHGAYCGRCFACLNSLCQAHCASLSGGERAGSSKTVPAFFVDGLAPVERKNDSQSGWAAIAEYRLADEGICTLLPADLDFRYAIAAECSVGMAFCAQEFMEVKAGDYLLLVGSGQRQFSLSHVIVGLFRGARVITDRNISHCRFMDSLGDPVFKCLRTSAGRRCGGDGPQIPGSLGLHIGPDDRKRFSVQYRRRQNELQFSAATRLCF
jgi:D-arabinose 1-dehydrogenase-like Zn-dependent alcohol dehydrogenase